MVGSMGYMQQNHDDKIHFLRSLAPGTSNAISRKVRATWTEATWRGGGWSSIRGRFAEIWKGIWGIYLYPFARLMMSLEYKQNEAQENKKLHPELFWEKLGFSSPGSWIEY